MPARHGLCALGASGVRSRVGSTLARSRRASQRADLQADRRRASAEVLHETLGKLGLTARQMAQARTRRQVLAATVNREGEAPAEPGTQARQEPRPPNSGQLRIVWQGAQDAVHSLALVNRNLCAALLARGHELSLLPASGYQADGGRVELPAAPAPRADVHVTHQWPPDFTPPAAGRWVVMQPWEFGSIPCAWLAPLRDRVDELWVPSQFVRDAFVRDGVPPGKVRVVPLGVSDVFFEDDVAAYPLRTAKSYKFLFVGGTTHRKGFDLLLKAYRQVFCDRDDVCLVVKDMGVGTFYQGQTAQTRIDAMRKLPHAPEV
jgi:glycosyltransferase involved in cell wall biosynthesis